MTTATDGALVTHDPNAQSIIRFDWTDETPARAEPVSGILQPMVPVSVASSQWTVAGPDALLTVDSPAIVDASTTRIRVSGGTRSQVYAISNRVEFNVWPPRVAVAHFSILVQT